MTNRGKSERAAAMRAGTNSDRSLMLSILARKENHSPWFERVALIKCSIEEMAVVAMLNNVMSKEATVHCK
jgi:hypothetical protein